MFSYGVCEHACVGDSGLLMFNNRQFTAQVLSHRGHKIWSRSHLCAEERAYLVVNVKVSGKTSMVCLVTGETSGPSPWCGHAVCFPGSTGSCEPGYLKLTFSCEQHATPKKEWTKKPAAPPCRELPRRPEDESDYTLDSLTWESCLKAKGRTTETAKVSAEACAQGWGKGVGKGGGEGERGQGEDEGKEFQGCRKLCSGHSRGEGRVGLGHPWAVRLPRCQPTPPSAGPDSRLTESQSSEEQELDEPPADAPEETGAAPPGQDGEPDLLPEEPALLPSQHAAGRQVAHLPAPEAGGRIPEWRAEVCPSRRAFSENLTVRIFTAGRHPLLFSQAR